MASFEETLFQICEHELPLGEVEQWVYDSVELEERVGRWDYIDLLALDYRQESSLHKVSDILSKYIDEGQYHTWRLIRILRRISNREPDVVMAIRETYKLYMRGYSFLRKLGMGYGLSLIVPPDEYAVDRWAELSQQERASILDSMYPNVIQEAKSVLTQLERGEIVLTGKRDKFGQFEFLERAAS